MVELDSRDRSTILVHYYRAMVGRADIWRMRMDATTNWAIGATAAVVTFALGNPGTPHFVVGFASLLTLGFLLLESRRLTFYHLWQQRVLLLERALVRPALESARPGVDLEALARDLGPELGRTVPRMSIAKAAARRLRRVYLFLFAVHWLAWWVKLWSQPSSATSLGEVVGRAHVGPVGGTWIIALTLVGLAGAIALALSAGGVERVGGVDRPLDAAT